MHACIMIRYIECWDKYTTSPGNSIYVASYVHSYYNYYNSIIETLDTCPKFLSSKSLQCKGPVLYPAKNEEINGIAPYQKLLTTCDSQVGHMWVTSGLFCGSVGQMGSTGVTHFQP